MIKNESLCEASELLQAQRVRGFEVISVPLLAGVVNNL